MYRRAVLALVAVGLLVASGCTSPWGGGVTETVTPALVPKSNGSEPVIVGTTTPTTTTTQNCLWVRDANRTGKVWICTSPDLDEGEKSPESNVYWTFATPENVTVNETGRAPPSR